MSAEKASVKVVAVSGSLREGSANTALVRALPLLAPAGIDVAVFDGIGSLPHYSPELDTDTPPASAAAWRGALREADAVLFCTPEYAHGMPGSLKNALDWLVSSGEFDGGKPVSAISASPSFQGGHHALAWLVQTLAVLGASVPPEAAFAVPYVRTKLSAEGNVTDTALAAQLSAALQVLANAAAVRFSAAPLP